jgi:hypothetical protein
LDQLKLRAQTVWIFLDPSVRAKLQIEDAQIRSVIGEITKAETLCRETRQRAGRGQADSPEVVARIEQFRDDAWRACLRHLSAEQRAILDQLRGPEPAFEVHKLRFGVGIGRPDSA